MSKIMKDYDRRHKDKFTAFSTIEDSDEDEDEEEIQAGDSDDESNDLSENENKEMFGGSGRSPDSPIGSVKRSVTNKEGNFNK